MINICKKILLCFIIIVFYCSLSSHAIVINDKYNDKDYIVNGAKFNNVIRINTTPTFSSGVLLNNHWLITTKHSVEYKKQIEILYNNSIYRPIKIIKHPILDVALIKVEIPEFLEKTVLCNHININDPCIIVGFGKTGNGKIGSVKYDFIKRAANNTIYGIQGDLCYCKFDENSTIELNGISAVGDSGGGLFLKNGDLIGINAIVKSKDGKPDSDYEDLSGHIMISSIYQWIVDNINH
jgi:S1-C subfamily serine protease